MRHLLFILVLALVACGASVNDPPAPPPCDPLCMDQVTVRAIRQTVKLAYNLTLQSKPVGPQDISTPCPNGGSAHITGTATSEASVGATSVDLVYTFDNCLYVQKDDTPGQNYSISLSGSIHEKGILSAQPTSTIAILFQSDAISVAGSVYEPALDFSAINCPLTITQNGNRGDAVLCGRAANLTF